MTPLVNELESDDTILIPINPVERAGTPTSAAEILNRLNEISFNAVLLKELRMIALLRQFATSSDLKNPEDTELANWGRMRVHMVRNNVMDKLGYSSKLNAEWEFLTMLKEEGRNAASAFLEEHADDLGKRSTLDIDQLVSKD
jgi:NTE family protein